MNPITLADALTAAANHPDLAEHRNKFLKILEDIGKDAAGIVLFPIVIATGVADR